MSPTCRPRRGPGVLAVWRRRRCPPPARPGRWRGKRAQRRGRAGRRWRRGPRRGQPVPLDVRTLRGRFAVEKHPEILERETPRLSLLGEGRELCADAIELHERDEGVGQRIQPGFQRAAHVLQVGPELGGLTPLACAAGRHHVGLFFQLPLQSPHGGVGMLPEPECLTHLRNTATARGHPRSLPGARHRVRGFPPPGPAVPLTARDGRLHAASRRLAGWGHVPHLCA